MNTTPTATPPEANTAPDKDGKGVVSAATGSPFDAEIARLQAARDKWYERGKLGCSSAELERSLTLAQWQRSQTGTDLAEWIRELIKFLNPPHESQIDLVLWEVFHRLRGKPARKKRMDVEVEELMENTDSATAG
jgi:hypothetical protein